MRRKPIILIMTSHEEQSGVAEKLKRRIMESGTHNAVVISDEKYGSVAKLSVLDRLMDTGQEYQYLLESKDRGVIRDKLRLRKFSKRVTRIGNMLKRFNPEYILCVTPYAHHCATEAKKKLRFSNKIIYYMMSFTAPKRGIDDATDVYIVENADVKASLSRMGIHPKDIVTLGLPIDAEKLPEHDRAALKQELGLPRNKAAFISIRDFKKLQSVFSLILDQGNIATFIVECENQKRRQVLSALASETEDVNIVFVTSREKEDEYLSVSDVAVLSYDVPKVYKCMKLGVAPIVLSESGNAEQEMAYLLSNGLIVRAKEDIEVVGLLYKMLQTDLAPTLAANGQRATEFASIENITNFLITYIGV